MGDGGHRFPPGPSSEVHLGRLEWKGKIMEKSSKNIWKLDKPWKNGVKLWENVVKTTEKPSKTLETLSKTMEKSGKATEKLNKTIE